MAKTAVVGEKDLATNQITAEPVKSTDKETPQAFVNEHTDPGATADGDDSSAYDGLPRNYEAVKHSVGEYVLAAWCQQTASSPFGQY